MRFLINSFPVVLFSADAAGGGSANPIGATPAANSDGATTGGAAGADTERRDATVVFPTLDAVRSATPPKTYRRYCVKGADGKEGYAIARQPREAVGAIALANGWSVENIDRGARAPVGDAELGAALEKMTPEARQALLEKYLGGATASAPSPQVAAGAQNVKAVAGAATSGVSGTATNPAPVATTSTTPAATTTPPGAGNKSAPATTAGGRRK